MKNRQQNTTSYPMCFLMVSSTDHITPVTGLTPTVTISKNGAAFGSPSGAVSEIGSGWYALAGNATDRNTLGDLLIHATGTGADPVDDRYSIVAYNPYDSVRMGLSALPNAAADAAGGLPISDAGGLDLDTRLNHLDAAISSRSSHSAADVWAVGTRTLSSFGTLVSDIVSGVWSAGTRTLSGFGSLVADIWSYATRALTDKAGFTISGTKQTLDALNDVSSSTVRAQADAALAAYDAPTKAELDAAVAPLAMVKTATDKLDTAMQADGSVYRFTQNALELAPTGSGGGSGLAGSNAVVINVHDGVGANVVESAVEIWDSAGTTFYERKTSDSSGQASFNMDDGTYTVKIHKAGYSKADQTLVVPDTLNPIYVMAAYSVSAPADSTLCRLYAYIKNADGSIPETVTASLTIVSLPKEVDNTFYSGAALTGVYSSTTGLLYFDVIQGATVRLKIGAWGVDETFTVPALATDDIGGLI